MDMTYEFVKVLLGQEIAASTINGMEYTPHVDKGWDPYSVVFNVRATGTLLSVILPSVLLCFSTSSNLSLLSLFLIRVQEHVRKGEGATMLGVCSYWRPTRLLERIPPGPLEIASARWDLLLIVPEISQRERSRRTLGKLGVYTL